MLALYLAQVTTTPQQSFYDELRRALAAGSKPRLEASFARKGDAEYLWHLGEGANGLNKLGVKMIPVPPGWEDQGGFWVTFHTAQDIQADHDPVYAVIRTGEGLKLGKEIPEDFPVSSRIANSRVGATLVPKAGRVDVRTALDMVPWAGSVAPVFRLNDFYQVETAAIEKKGATVVTAGATIPEIKPGQVLRAGGLLIPWNTNYSWFACNYSAVVPEGIPDQIKATHAYLTAWWVPSVGRLPHPSTVTIAAPDNWVVRSEGVLQDLEKENGQQRAVYDCEIPITFPKIIGGEYVLAAEAKVGERYLRSYQFAPVDKARANKDVANMVTALKFYEKSLSTWPFPGYEVFDGKNYYGIESYSYTLLSPSITTKEVSHEMGHTFFGGLVPCGYIKDSWNEGVTTYVDAIVSGSNTHQPLDEALRSVDAGVSLSGMGGSAWAYDNLSYDRGAAVMKMLEGEIGLTAVLDGLKALIKDRQGKATSWNDLRPYFEKSSGKPLSWFWDQWINGARFPKLEVMSATTTLKGKVYSTRITIKQSGTEDLFRLRFVLRAMKGTQIGRQTVSMTAPQGTFTVETSFKPTSADIDVRGWVLTKPPTARTVTN